MVSKLNKKGAVELSLNLIIMLIIGMVVLGLVIGFVNSLVNQGSATFEEQIGDNDKLKLDEIMNCGDNLCVLPNPTIRASKGQNTKVYFKIRNFNSDGDIDCDPGQDLETGTCDGIGYEIVDQEGGDVTEGTDFIITGPGFPTMKGGEEKAAMYSLKTDQGVAVGTYYITFKIFPGEDDEESVVLTLEVE